MSTLSLDSAPDGYMDSDDLIVTHDCCRHCDVPLCFDDMDCRCGLPKYDDHEGSAECHAGR